MKIDELIGKSAEKTARAIVAEMKRAGMIKENHLSSFKKTERALYEFYEWKKQGQLSDETKRFCDLIEKSLERVREDPYFEIIELKYGIGWTHEHIAEYFNVDVSVISKRRTKLINQLRPIIFSDDFIHELYEQ